MTRKRKMFSSRLTVACTYHSQATSHRLDGSDSESDTPIRDRDGHYGRFLPNSTPSDFCAHTISNRIFIISPKDSRSSPQPAPARLPFPSFHLFSSLPRCHLRPDHDNHESGNPDSVNFTAAATVIRMAVGRHHCGPQNVALCGRRGRFVAF